MKVYFRKQLLANLVSVITLTSVPIDHAQAIAYRYDISGFIDRIFDTSDLLTDVDIVPGSSTFTGSFTYDPTPTSSYQFDYDYNRYFLEGSFDLTIDDRYDFSLDSESEYRFFADVINDRWDRDTLSYGGHAAGYTDGWGLPQGDSHSHLNLWFKDSSSSAFSDASLPQDINLADYDSPVLHIYSYNDDYTVNGRYGIVGVVTSLEETIISEQEPDVISVYDLSPYDGEISITGLPGIEATFGYSFFGTEIQAEFIVRDNKTLADAAIAGGFDHFNWVQMVLEYPDTLTGCLGDTPFLDPPLGGCIIPPITADMLPFYYDEGDEFIDTPYYLGDRYIDGYNRTTSELVEVGIRFSDQPFSPSASEDNPMSFALFPVGVNDDGTWTSLAAEALFWSSTNNFFGGEIGETIYRSNPIPGGPEGDYLSGEFGSLSSLTVDQRLVLVENRYVGEFISTPEPATLVLMGLGLAGIGYSRKKKYS